MAKIFKKTYKKWQKIYSKLRKKWQKILTIFYIYDNNIINGGNNDEEII